MKYKLVKLVQGSLNISDEVTLTDENPTIVIEGSIVDTIECFDLYKSDNPFCRVCEIKEEVKILKKIK